MPCKAYIDKNFQAKSLELIAQMKHIIRKFTDMGYELTLRQILSNSRD